jgi:hypothetical protein
MIPDGLTMGHNFQKKFGSRQGRFKRIKYSSFFGEISKRGKAIKKIIPSLKRL